MHKLNKPQNLTPEMMRWVSLTRLISGVSRTKAALPWTCLRKLSEYSTWWRAGQHRTHSERLKCFKPEAITQQWLASTAQRVWQRDQMVRGHTQLLTEWAGALWGSQTNVLAGRFLLRGSSIKSNKITSQSSVGGRGREGGGGQDEE